MLYDLDWLAAEKPYPPKDEADRLKTYEHYAALFDLNGFKDFTDHGNRLIANFDTYFNMPMLLGYQRLSTIKLADMVIGAPPTITVNDDDDMTDKITDIRDQSDFNSKLYQMLIDFSRYGATVVRLFNDDLVEDKDSANFAVWSPGEWFPILMKDGTKRIEYHVLGWKFNNGTENNPDWVLDIQIHPTKGGTYTKKRYQLDANGSTIVGEIAAETKEVNTEGMPCLVQYMTNLPSTTNIYGTSDYKIINGLIVRATERMQQILYILDRHADPSLTGPTTLLETDQQTGELVFKTSQFYGTSPGEEPPQYLTWDGKLESAFEALKQLLNQIYIFSEMGPAMLGNADNAGQAVSGTAMRYKMIAPLEKARRVSNSFTLPIKKLISAMVKLEFGRDLRYQDVNIIWEDSLPKDPRETAELARLQTGAPQVIPLKHALMQNYDMDAEDAEHFIEEIEEDQKLWESIKAIYANQNKGAGENYDDHSGTGSSKPGEEGNPAAPPSVLRHGSKRDVRNSGRDGQKK